jgi:hypothetical protein
LINDNLCETHQQEPENGRDLHRIFFSLAAGSLSKLRDLVNQKAGKIGRGTKPGKLNVRICAAMLLRESGPPSAEKT